MKSIKKCLKVVSLVLACAGLTKLIISILKMNKEVGIHKKVLKFNADSILYSGVFYGDSIGAVFSGVDIEFEDDTIIEGPLVIYGRYSGYKISVPKNYCIELEGSNNNSGISKQYIENEEGQTLRIQYNLGASGLNIKNN